jgi:uncharacterized protein YbjQ (UPF0145 family)
VTSDSGSQGLPQAAKARIADMAGHHSWGSTLSVPEFAAISKVGFEPVGQVLGAAVWNVGDTGGEDCPYGRAYLGEGMPTRPAAGGAGFIRTVAAPQGAAAIGSARPLVSALYQARRAAINRMTAECAALGGHGVIGVTLTVGPFAEDTLEFRAFGTAVRGRGAAPLSRPFASDLSGQDFTKLVGYGWVPVGLAMGIAVGFRHDDRQTLSQTRATAGNAEIPGYTFLITQMRTDARNELQLDLVRMGADGVVAREMETRLTERACPIVPLGRDHVVEATILGTAITQFARLAPPPVYGIRRLSTKRPEPAAQRQMSVSLEGEAEAAEDDGAAPGSRRPDEPGEPTGPGQDR